MADSVKAQKLAAARKKLKEYQQKSQKPTKNSTINDEVLQSFDALSNSTHSSINGSLDNVPLESISNKDINQMSPFHNYFDPNVQNVTVNQHNFFDSVSQQSHDNYSSLNYTQEDNTFQTPNIVNQNEFVIDKDTHSIEYPEIQENNVFEIYTQKHTDHPFVSFEDAKKLYEYMEEPASKKSGSIEKPSTVLDEKTVIHSSVESLRQLSSQINELIKDEPVSYTAETNELERRNVELAGLLEQERVTSQTSQAQLREYQIRIEQLQSECQQIKTDYEHRLNREIGPLQEQLQCHAQTVGILIGEKTELSSALSQSQFLAKQKVSECEELQGRLKTSRSRVADLEKELQTLKVAKQKYEQGNVFEEKIEKWKKDYEQLKERYDEVNQDLLESREKLNIKTKENLELQQQVQEASHQLSLAKVKIEQITAGGNLEAESQIEFITQQKITLERQVLELSQALKSTSEERDQASLQYQHYVQQLNSQIASLAQKLEHTTTENESLNKRETNLVHHIGELEKHLQKLQNENLNAAANRNVGTDVKKNLDTALEQLQNLQIDKEKLEQRYEVIVTERDDLLRDLDSKKETVEKLESQLENYQTDQPDNVKLLAAMESDKIAASRAVEQNSQLKQQLEEMQQAFVRMSNDKLDLTEKLSSEEYHSKELSEKLVQTEHQLHTLSDAIAIKDNELTHIRDTLNNQNKAHLEHDHSHDHEDHDGCSHSHENDEIQQAQQLIEHLTNENQILKNEINKLTNSVQDQLCSERLQLLSKSNADSLNIEVGSQTVSDGDDAKSIDLSMLDKEVAMKHLEEKFTRTMADIANLTEEKQRLEHIVMQLQDETETIGEYIALYQHQRGILQQRTQEKDDQLKRLAYDRETVRRKLDSLNDLIKKLILEKGALTPEFLEQHRKITYEKQDLCSEHAKIHDEMQKMVEPNVNQLNENNNVQQNTETAEEIIALLTDIKTSNLIQPRESLENFHPCAWCSGQLLTV